MVITIVSFFCLVVVPFIYVSFNSLSTSLVLNHRLPVHGDAADATTAIDGDESSNE